MHVFYPLAKSIQQSVAKKIFAIIACTRKQLFESLLKQKVQHFNCHTWKLPYLLSSKAPTNAFITNSQRPTQHYRCVLVNLSQFNSKPGNVLPCVWYCVPCICVRKVISVRGASLPHNVKFHWRNDKGGSLPCKFGIPFKRISDVLFMSTSPSFLFEKGYV